MFCPLSSILLVSLLLLMSVAVEISIVEVWHSELGHRAPPCSRTPAMTHGGNLELQALNV